MILRMRIRFRIIRRIIGSDVLLDGLFYFIIVFLLSYFTSMGCIS